MTAEPEKVQPFYILNLPGSVGENGFSVASRVKSWDAE